MVMKKELLIKTLRNTSGAVIYIFIVSQVMQNAGKLFGQKDNFFTPFAVLLLFCLSAAVVVGLVLGQSIILFFDNKKPRVSKQLFIALGGSESIPYWDF